MELDAMYEKRASGILLHITSLPSPYGIGDLGPCSYRFVELLSENSQQYWSILPLTQTGAQYDYSPYQPDSAFAGNKLLISPDLLTDDGLIPKDYARTHMVLPGGKVDYEKVAVRKEQMLRKAYDGFKGTDKGEFERFCGENSAWLDDYVMFRALVKSRNEPWYLWPKELRDRRCADAGKSDLRGIAELERFAQFLFYRQLSALRRKCDGRGIKIVGDLPFYVSYDSSDVWSHPELFKLDPCKRPRYVGGVPPDYFSTDGQLWGNPVYNWRRMEEDDFGWWRGRIKHNLKIYDKLRLDHFRGFVAYWQVKASAANAKKGRWIKAPWESLFGSISRQFPDLPFVAEDLGMITDDVMESIRRLGIPGMRVLVFAFDGDVDNPHLPENHPRNSVAMTGTHDTNTVRGWFAEEATSEQRDQLFRHVGKKVSEGEVGLEFIKMAIASAASLRIIPLQDALSLGSEARMNNPANGKGNWRWRASSEQLANVRRLMNLGQ